MRSDNHRKNSEFSFFLVPLQKKQVTTTICKRNKLQLPFAKETSYNYHLYLKSATYRV